jgi:hypothetical protein
MKKSNQMQFAVLKLTLFLAIAFCFAGCAKKDVQEQQAKSGLDIYASQLASSGCSMLLDQYYQRC